MKKIGMLTTLFGVFFKITLFTLGGGYVILPVIEDEVVKKRKWINSEEFHEYITVVQGTPGSLAVNCATFIGYRMAGMPGAIASVLGSIIPSLVIIVIIAATFTDFNKHPIVLKIFQGVRPAALAMILYFGVNMALKTKWDILKGSIFIFAFISFIVYHANPIYLVIFGLFLGASKAWLSKGA